MNNNAGGLDGWHNDGSGPRETSIGAFKNAKTILNRFYAGTREMGVTWDWHAADDRGRGAGSHVHLCLEQDVFDDHIAGWTVAYNTVIETFPFFAPYFCHDWQNGFREGTGTVREWARPNLTRFSQDTVRDRVNSPTSGRRPYHSVTFNPAQRRSGKPLTIELRANDAHPAMALPGLLQLRRLTGRAIEAGWSPKLANRRDTLDQVYEKIYRRAERVGLLTAMQEPIDGGITFLDGRGLPHVDKLEYDTAFDVLRAIQIAQPETPNTWTCRPYNLVRAGEDSFSPARNQAALWNMDGASGSFNWTTGPQDATSEVRA